MAVATPPLPDRKFIEPLFRAIKHVFETNLVRRTEMQGIYTIEQLVDAVKGKDKNFTISAIKFSGDFVGTVALIIPDNLNYAYARDFLDVDESMLQLGAEKPVYRDAAGEITNMLSGTFRNMLAKGQLHCHLTPPASIDGFSSLISSIVKAKSAMISCIKVEEFVVYVCLWS